MKTTRFFLLPLLLVAWVYSSPSVAQIVNIPDANLREAIVETLGKPSRVPLTRLDMARLERLIAHDRGIRDLSGLEFATNLVEIQANRNFITDLSPIAGLIHLRDLHLASNLIPDVSPIAALTNLDQLDLQNNAIADFSPLERLAEKIFIQVAGNPGASTINKKIEGPWLWVILPTGGGGGASAALSGIDFLAFMSQDLVTELEVATNGATQGAPVGHSQWTLHTLSPEGSNNINDMAIRAGLGSGDINYHVAYGSIILDSPRQQQTRMYVGSDDAVKVWLNGELVHNNPVNRGAGDFQEQFAVTLQEGENVLLVAVYEAGGGWSGFFGFPADAEYTVNTPNENAYLAEDINADGVVNVQDLVIVSLNLGKTGKNQADVNADGVVNIQDLVLVANAFDTVAAAPSAQNLHASHVQRWVQLAKRVGDQPGQSSLYPGDAYQRGIAALEQLAASLIPRSSALLPNYPNPFNPETWIPYRLSNPSEVEIHIYDARGSVVRQLDLGYQPAGLYQTRHRAVYWDGKNDTGESVASGVYFYTLTAGDFSATRKMLILK